MTNTDKSGSEIPEDIRQVLLEMFADMQTHGSYYQLVDGKAVERIGRDQTEGVEYDSGVTTTQTIVETAETQDDVGVSNNE